MTAKAINWEEIHTWYQWLQETKIRALKAELKRCKKISDVYMQPAYVKLVRHIGGNVDVNSFLPVIAGVLAHTECSNENKEAITLATRMATKLKQNRPAISPLRFKQLLACEDEDKLLRLLIRIVKQVEFFDIVDFAESLYYWGINGGVKTKKQWAYNYYTNLSEEFLQKST